MLRILYAAFDRVPAPKGASRHILAFTHGLHAAGHRVDVCVLTDASVTLPQAPIRFLPPPPPCENTVARAVAFGEHVLAYARSGRYDLIHFRSPWEGLPLTQWQQRPPLVFEVNGLPSVEWPENYPDLQNSPGLIDKLRRREDAVLQAVDAIITPSRLTATWLTNRTNRTVTVIPNGVDLVAWQKPRQPAFGEIAYQGSFHSWQGVDTAITALAELPPPIVLRLIGPRERGEGGRLVRLAQRLGVGDRVLLQPAVSVNVLARILTRAHLAIAPLANCRRNRLQGACPLKILEYLASGCPLVASRLPLVEELVTHGETAWLVEPDDPSAWARALRELVESDRMTDRLADTGRRHVQSFTWSESITKLLAVYQAVVPG